MLGITEPNVDMHVDGPQSYARGEKEPGQVKEMMKIISSMNPTKSDVQNLTNCSMFQVRRADGIPAWPASMLTLQLLIEKSMARRFKTRSRL
jgi:hypothetical protein